MLHKIIAAGRHGSTLDYLLQSKGRSTAPEVLRGDPALVQELIHGSRSRNPRTTACLSFQERAESVTQEHIDSVIDAYEELLFAGLDASNLARCWIMHTDKAQGRLELNCVVLNQDLVTGKVLGLYVHTRDAKTFLQWVELTCREHGFTSPNDPEKARGYSISNRLPRRRAEAQLLLGQSIGEAVAAGAVRDRAGVVAHLEAAGFQIARAGTDYITVVDTDDSRLRLTGDFYRADWQVGNPTATGSKRFVPSSTTWSPPDCARR